MGMIDHHAVEWARDLATIQYRRGLGRWYLVAKHAVMRLEEILSGEKKVKGLRRMSVKLERPIKIQSRKTDEINRTEFVKV